jgi:aspartyl-tRNA(Asn)/glutamyl-tRNA(Gln) amidotransferase subunit C
MNRQPRALPRVIRKPRCNAKARDAIGAGLASFASLGADMSVDQANVRRIAHLARIAVSDDEVPHLMGEINAILSFVEALGAVDVEGVEPMTSVIPMQLPMRPDVVTDGEIEGLVLANAPLVEDNFFLVPKVVE